MADKCTCNFPDICDGEGVIECLGCNGGELDSECRCPSAAGLAQTNSDGEEYCCCVDCEGCDECEDDEEDEFEDDEEDEYTEDDE